MLENGLVVELGRFLSLGDVGGLGRCGMTNGVRTTQLSSFFELLMKSVYADRIYTSVVKIQIAMQGVAVLHRISQSIQVHIYEGRFWGV